MSLPRRAARSTVLRGNDVFEAVLRSGSRICSANFVARTRANELEHARLGIIAGRKAAARAVDRNRGKRLIRAAFRAAAPSLGALDVTIQLRNDLRRESGAALRAELDTLLNRVTRRGAAAARNGP